MQHEMLPHIGVRIESLNHSRVPKLISSRVPGGSDGKRLSLFRQLVNVATFY